MPRQPRSAANAPAKRTRRVAANRPRRVPPPPAPLPRPQSAANGDNGLTSMSNQMMSNYFNSPMLQMLLMQMQLQQQQENLISFATVPAVTSNPPLFNQQQFPLSVPHLLPATHVSAFSPSVLQQPVYDLDLLKAAYPAFNWDVHIENQTHQEAPAVAAKDVPQKLSEDNDSAMIVDDASVNASKIQEALLTMDAVELFGLQCGLQSLLLSPQSDSGSSCSPTMPNLPMATGRKEEAAQVQKPLKENKPPKRADDELPEGKIEGEVYLLDKMQRTVFDAHVGDVIFKALMFE